MPRHSMPCSWIKIKLQESALVLLQVGLEIKCGSSEFTEQGPLSTEPSWQPSLLFIMSGP